MGVAGWRFAHTRKTSRVRTVVVGVLEELRREGARLVPKPAAPNMPNFEICWNRRRLEWRRDPENAPLLIEAILLERVLLDGRPQLEIVAGLAAIDEDRTDEAAARDLFWRDARRKLGKLRRLSPRDIWQVEIMLAMRIPKPQNRMPPQPSTVRASANPVTGPHQPLRQVLGAR
jgi:hypothetical protein